MSSHPGRARASRLDRPTPRVVIIGAGFAGTSAAATLADSSMQVTLVDRHDYTTFQPLLYQVATAGLNPGDVAYPLRTLVRSLGTARFRRGPIVSVDFEQREAVLADGSSLPYDYLVIAAGATTSFFAVPGAEAHAKAMYTLDDALEVRRRIFSALEGASAEASSDAGADHSLQIVVIGGGATGVEMAGALAELLSLALTTTYRELDAGLVKVVLVEQRDRLLAGFAEGLGRYAEEELARRGVELRLGDEVLEVREDKVIVCSPERGQEEISCALVVWAAGVSAAQLAAAVKLPTTRGGRIAVDGSLAVPGRPEVFVAGDIAGARSVVPVESADGAPSHERDVAEPSLLPQLAQPAIQTGRHAAMEILRREAGLPSEPFVYKDKGIMATIGRRAAVAEVPVRLPGVSGLRSRSTVRLRGTTAWLAWLLLHLVTLLGKRNRASVLLNWAWRYVSWRRGPRVIVGG